MNEACAPLLLRSSEGGRGLQEKNMTPKAVDPRNPLMPSYTGIYEDTVEINGKRRQFITYIPECVRASTAGILVLPEDGVTANDMLTKSNWTELGDSDERKEKFIVFFLEPENGTWKTEEAYGRRDGDVAYIQAVLSQASRRNKFCVHESKFYLVGYRAGGTLAQMAAAENPSAYAGVASVEAPPVSPAYLEACGSAPCVNLNGYIDELGLRGIKKRDIPMPVWLIGESDAAELAESTEAKYWRSAAGTAPKPRMLRPDVVEYYRNEEPAYGCNQEKEAYRVWISTLPGVAAEFGRKINRRLWSEFLYGVRRWMADPGGDLRRTYDPIRDLGMDYHWEMVGGWMREWYIYVPDSIRKNPDKPTPLVFAIHGYTCSGEIYTGNSEWFKVAREYGFIVVFPSAVHGRFEVVEENQAVSKDATNLPVWNIACDPEQPDEIRFFEHLLVDVASTYSIDRGRVYITGHSMGSMMAQMMAMARPELFAAAAPCSGVLIMFESDFLTGMSEVRKRLPLDIPIWMFAGEQEAWLLPHIPEKDNITGQTIQVWWELNHMPGAKPDTFDHWSICRERWHELCYLKKGIPMIQYSWVECMPHATMTEMSYRIWEEFFSHIRRGQDKEIIWMDR